jgi:hypothetical protein
VADSSPARSSRIDLACQVGIGLALLLFAFQGLFEDGGQWAVQDHVITHSFSERVASEGLYDRDFLYPLPAVVMKLVLGRAGLGLSSVLWSALSIASAFAALRAALILLDRGGRTGLEGAWGSAALAFVAVIYFVQWDIRAVNSNTVYLALVLWSRVYGDRGRVGMAGGLLATAIALKLYAAVILLHLLWRGRWAELRWVASWGVALFALVPALYFGPAEAAQLTLRWLDNVASTSGPQFVLDLVAYKVSLSYVMLSFAGATEGAASSSGEAIRSAMFWTRGVQVAWLVGLGLHFFWPRRLWRQRLRSQRRAAPNGRVPGSDLVDYSLLLITTLVLSPLLEPHHGAILLAPAVLFADAALDGRRRIDARWIGGGTLLVCALCMKLLAPGLPKAVGVNAVLLTYACVLVTLKPRGVLSQSEGREPLRP